MTQIDTEELKMWSSKAMNILDLLIASGYDSYIVGGAVRDILQGETPADIDIATAARPEQILELFGTERANAINGSFGIVLVDDIEVATFRLDRQQLAGRKNCEVSYADTIQDDLVRRDLTFNALAICHTTGDVIDMSGGFNDLKNKIVRFVGNPKDRIWEDPVRIVRACRFSAFMDAEFETETFKYMREGVELFFDAHPHDKYVSYDRLSKEIMKAMKIKKASAFFASLHSVGLLKHIFPSMEKCFMHSHGRWHIETVLDHLMLVGDAIKTENPLLKLAAYLHDVGKPEVADTNEDGHTTFKGHEKVGELLVRDELKRLKFSHDQIDFIGNMVGAHMYLLNDLGKRGMRRLKKKLHDRKISPEDLITVRLADKEGNLKSSGLTETDIANINNLLASPEVSDSPMGVTDLEVSGKDVMDHFNIPPGPAVGLALQAMLDMVLELGPKYNNRETLLSIEF